MSSERQTHMITRFLERFFRAVQTSRVTQMSFVVALLVIILGTAFLPRVFTPAVNAAFSCSSETVGRTVDIFLSDVPGVSGNEWVLVGGEWGWKLVHMRSPNAVQRSGTDPTISVSGTYIAAGFLATSAKTFAVGGRDGWKGFDMTQAGIPEIFSSPLPTFMVDTHYDGTMFAGGPSGWEVRDMAGTVLRSGSESIVAGGIFNDAGLAKGVYLGGSWGWKIQMLDGTELASGTDVITAMRDSFGVYAYQGIAFGGQWGFKLYDVQNGIVYSGTRPTRVIEPAIVNPTPSDDLIYLGNGNGLWKVDWRSDTTTQKTSDEIVALDANDTDTSPAIAQIYIYGGPDGWGRFSESGPQTVFDTRPVWAVATQHYTASAQVNMIGGGTWGWEVRNESGTLLGSGTDDVSACLDLTPPPPPVSTSLKANAYNGSVQIIGPGAAADALVLGTGGSVIAGTGEIFMRPNNSFAASYFRGVANKQEQGLLLDSKAWDTTALQLHNSSATQHTLAAIADAPGTTAAIFYGDVRIEGNLLKGNWAAVVETSTGPLKLSVLEAPDARFVEYGSGKTEGGIVRIAIDPAFAETVSLEDYQVFLSPMGSPAALAVTDQTAEGFTVLSSTDTVFSYKLVALRKEYEHKRFEQ